ncbi:MAG TPA: hypothetical protein VN363_06840 [Anaerolineales bacterium]|nr:hypothetical protein [Anaerolineales bacterium]
MMDFSKIKLGHLVFFTALLLAGFVRFLNLGEAPLNDSEARLALDAWRVAQGVSDVGEFNPAPYPGYILVTGLLFGLLEPTNFLARFLPALAGVSLLLVPILLRDRLGMPAALVLAFGLALDPGLVAASRLVAGPMPALAFGLLAGIAWQQGRPRLAGLLGALLLLSGPPAMQGIVIVLATFILLRFLPDPDESTSAQPAIKQGTSSQQIQALGVLVISLLAIGTLFLQIPQGLAALANSFLAYFSGWAGSSGVPAGRVAAALLIYQPVALIFMLLSIARTLYRRQVDYLDLLLIFATGIALLHGLLYPDRQTLDLVWVLTPMWLLASRELIRQIDQSQQHLAAYGLGLLIVLLAGLLWFNLAGLSRADPQLNNATARLLLMAGVVLLAAVTTILVTMGWTWKNGKFGLVLGSIGAGSLYLISVLWGSTQVRANLPAELWYSGGAGSQADLLAKTTHELSVWTTGFPDQVEIVLKGESPSVQWVLRDFSELKIVDIIPTQDLPAILITPQTEQPPALTAAYRGQDFNWWVYPGWVNALPENLPAWITFREAPLTQKQIILWARSDLFPGGELEISNSEN